MDAAEQMGAQVFCKQWREAGSGYWLGKLPTPRVKWTIGSVSKCYKYWSNSPLEVANSNDLECDLMGVIAVSNRLLYPPDGIGFVNDGMLGHAWINTPLGKTGKSRVVISHSSSTRLISKAQLLTCYLNIITYNHNGKIKKGTFIQWKPSQTLV